MEAMDGGREGGRERFKGGKERWDGGSDRRKELR